MVLKEMTILAIVDYAMYKDTIRFTDVPEGSRIQEGDIVWFGPVRLAVPES